MEHSRNRPPSAAAYTAHANEKSEQAQFSLPFYERPHVVSYTDEDILDALGPAQTLISDNRLGY